MPLLPPPSPPSTLPTTPSAALFALHNTLHSPTSPSHYQPFIYPHRALAPNLLILYLLLPPTKSRLMFYLRYPLFVLICWLSANAIRECRSGMVTVGYGIGLLNAWAGLWSWVVLFGGERARLEMQWGERGERQKEGEEEEVGEDGVVMRATERDVKEGKMEEVRARGENGHMREISRRRGEEKGKGGETRVVYQSLPAGFYHRVDWVLDLVSNFRGVRWKHQIFGLAPPPPHLQAGLKDPTLPPPTAESHLTRTDLLRRDLPSFIICLFALDVLKAITLQDPYFWGLPPSTPSPFPWPLVSRLVLSLTFVYTSLLTIYLLAPLVFGVLLGPRWLGQHAWPWLYAPYFGAPSQIWRKGIAGFWGGWWHQLFRHAFEQAGEFVAGVVGWEKKTQRGMILRLFTAFLCSGILHACASYTSLGETRPIRGSFLFFILQPVGIIAQRAITGWMRNTGLRDKIPLGLRYAGNLAVVATWCLLTGPNVADDFAATGIWLYEPLFISPIRGLRGEGWWRWGGTWVKWHSADRWWRSGLAF